MACPKCGTRNAFTYQRPMMVHQLSRRNTPTWETDLVPVGLGYWECKFCFYTREKRSA